MKQSKKIVAIALLVFAIMSLDYGVSFARYKYRPGELGPGPYKMAVGECRGHIEYGVHNVGKMGLSIANMGHFGKGFLDDLGIALEGDVPSCTYPYPGQIDYLFSGSFWIGAIVGRDTLVSVGADGWSYVMEMWPAPYPEGSIIRRSLSNPDAGEAISEQDFISVYVDTVQDPTCVDDDNYDNRPHRPLNIRVTQRSYAWSYSYAEDFVLFDYSIENIGTKTLEKVYMGIYVDGDVGREETWDDSQDDICGFRRSVPAVKDCPGEGWLDTINIAWIADADGKRSITDLPPCPGALTLTALTGTRVVRTPNADTLKYSFNWWVSNTNNGEDFGPRLSPTPDDPWRDFGGFLGTPEGDRNKYYIMRHEEFDYDQIFTAVDNTGTGWRSPPVAGLAINIADGFDTRYLLSFGPFDIHPGEVLPISFAYVAGEDFHTDCDAFDDIFNAYQPQAFYDYLDFDDLGKNAVWASWIYDNPGIDTDDNGFRGPSRYCIYDSIEVCDTISLDSIVCEWVFTDVDTIYTAGDNVPDFRGASPPPPPELWIVDDDGDTLRSKVYPRITEFNQGELVIRWNGMESETEKDRFSDDLDFEGYRIYMSLSPSPSGFSLVSSYDRDDYNRFTWNNSRGEWELLDIPFTRQDLKALYGSSFEPEDYDTPENIYTYVSPDFTDTTQYYFEPQDNNRSDLTDPDGIHKVYPNETLPSTLSLDSARLFYPEELTDDGLFFKYYEYEYIMRKLLPSQLYYVAVTAFDYGSPASELESLETAPYRNYIAEYAQNDNTMVAERGLDVVVYPNPWRIDGNYRENGFEGRDYTAGINTGSIIAQEGYPDDRTRSIHFTNLPPKCTIKIFTIDGDLVREIKHDVPPDSPRSMHERWDMITRNTQAVVSGIYYYSVESESGNQIGKIVIIM